MDQDSKLQQLLSRIKVSSEVEEMGEGMKAEVYTEINRRIDSNRQRMLYLRFAAVAASVILLLGISNYFSYHEGSKHVNNALVELTNPLGTKSEIKLSDGTRVILNAGTTLFYPAAFISKNREVKIKGEAFFEVAHDSDRPFIVKTDDISVQVLGTEFNVKAYQEEPVVEVTLAKGSVSVDMINRKDGVLMLPGQQVVFDKTNKSFRKYQVDQDYYTSWKDGKFYFKGMELTEITRQLERNFNISIVITSEKLRRTKLTGDFTKGENLEQVLKVLTMDKRIGYDIEKDRIVIYEK